VGHDEEHLFGSDLLLAQPSVLPVANLCCHAIDGFIAGQGAVHHGTAGRDCGTRIAGQLHPRAVDDGEQLLKRERFFGDRDGIHETSLNQRY
jgi:hypothetical protein